MENLIYIDSTTISPVALILCVTTIGIIGYCLAIFKEKWLGRRVIYP